MSTQMNYNIQILCIPIISSGSYICSGNFPPQNFTILKRE